MRWWRVLFARVTGLFVSRRRDEELRREISAHLDEAIDDNLRRGLSPAEARRVALVSFGGVAQTEDAYREHVSFRWLDLLRRDARQSARALRRSPGFSVVVLLVLAIGTGASTAVFTFLDRIVLRPLPFADANRLVAITHAVPGRNLRHAGLSDGLFFFYQQHAASLESIGLYTDSRLLNLRTASGQERIELRSATPAFFDVLQVKPRLGRLFTDDDARPGFSDMTWAIPVLLTDELWSERFGSDPAVIGRTITINDVSRLVIGVLPRGFAFPDARTQVWMLDEPAARRARLGGAFNWNAVARMRPGVTPASAEADLKRVLPQIVGAYPDATPALFAKLQVAPTVTPLKVAVIGDIAQVLWPLFGGMTCLLLIAAANAGGLFLIRAEHRRREIAVRQALGAGRGHLARQFFTEALVLTLASAALGLVLAKGLVWLVIALAPVDLPRVREVTIDATSVLFALGAAVTMAAFYGALSVRGQRRSTGNLLGNGQWATGSRTGRARDPFIVLQTALALALMAASALMVKTYENFSRTSLGFSPDHVLTVQIALPYRQASHDAQIYQGLVDRLRRLPGVVDASAANFMPLTDTPDMFPVEAGSAPIPFKFFVPGYFQAMKMPIVEGDGFGPDAHVAAPYPVLISAALAHRLFPDRSAIGQITQRLEKDGSPVQRYSKDVNGLVTVPPFTIVGVVGDARELTLRGDPTEVVYVPLIEPAVEQSIVPTDMTLIVRTAGDPNAALSMVHAAIADVDPALGVGQVRTMDAIVGAARGRETFVGVLLLMAAAVSLLLGVVGIYGGVAHVVRCRTREIGIRIALGARRMEVIRLVATGSLWAVAAGAVIGLAVAIAGTRLLRALLFGVAPRDPVVLIEVTLVLVIAASAAALLAAWRAVRVTPLVAMRES